VNQWPIRNLSGLRAGQPMAYQELGKGRTGNFFQIAVRVAVFEDHDSSDPDRLINGFTGT
jgi:hypothetical protein